jgi:glycosyltransferase involved in cell wall biosynthesis
LRCNCDLRALKILQILPTLDPNAGGVASAVLSLSRGLTRRGHKIEIVVLDDPAAPWLADADLTIHQLDRGLTNYCYSPKLLPWLRKHGGDYDRVIVNGLWQYLSFATWRRFGGSHVPYYVFPHGMLDPWFKRTYPVKHLKKWCYWPWAEYRVLRDARAVIFTSEQERTEARESFWLYRCREKISPLGVDAPAPVSSAVKETFLARFPQLRNQRALLFLGRLHPKKGCDIAIEALAALSGAGNISLVVAGPDQIGWRQELEKLAARLGVESRVIFTGMLQGDMKQGALGSAEALLLPSHQENFGMAVVDALAVGLPVLISNRINIWREIEADRAGYVANDNISGVKSLIDRWTITPPEQRDAMRSNARQCFINRFEISRAVDSLLKILSEDIASS